MLSSDFFILLICMSLAHGQDMCIMEGFEFNGRDDSSGCNSRPEVLQRCRRRSQDISNHTEEYYCGGNFTEEPLNLNCFDGVKRVNKKNYSSCFVVSDQQDVNESVLLSRNWKWYIYLCIQPIIVAFGLLGNTLSIILMASKEMRKLTFSCYLIGLAVSDSLSLLHFGMDWFDNVLSTPWFSMRLTTHSSCLVYPLLVRACYLNSAWLMVAFTLDRALSICAPFTAMKYISKRKSLLMTGLIPVACLLSQMYHPLLFPKNEGYCGDVFGLPKISHIDGFFPDEIPLILSRSVLLLNLPFFFIVVSNIAVVVAVKKRQTFKHLTTGYSKTNKDKVLPRLGKEAVMSLKLLSVSLTFLVLLLPDFVVMMLDVGSIVNHTKDWFLHGNWYRFICQMVFSLNFAINFFLYVFAFRKQLPVYCRSRIRDVAKQGQVNTECG